MISEPISISPYVNTLPNDQLISLDPGNAPPVTPNPEIAMNKGAKVEYGFPNLGDQEYLGQKIASGKENDLRNYAAAQVTADQTQKRKQALTDVLKTKQNLTYDDVKEMLDTPKPDPTSVFEDAYARTFTNPLINALDPFTANTFMPQVLDAAQKAVFKMKQDTDSIMAFQEHMDARTQQAEETLKGQNYFGRAVDFVKGQVGVYNEFKLRGWDGQYDWDSMLGSALSKERLRLWELPPKERIAEFDRRMSSLEKDNPGLAVMFGHSMQGMTLNEVDDQNAETGLTAFNMGTGVTASTIGSFVAGAMRGAARSAGTLANRPFNIATRPGWYTPGQLRGMSGALGTGAIKEAEFPRMFGPKELDRAGRPFPQGVEGIDDRFVQPRELTPFEIQEMKHGLQQGGTIPNEFSTASPGSFTPGFIKSISVQDIKSAAASGSGNLEGAAVQKTIDKMLKVEKGKADPIQDAIDALPTYFRTEADHYRTDPGAGGQELANRVAEQTERTDDNLNNALRTAVRVQRTPILVLSEDIAKLAVDKAKRMYSGPNSTVISINDPTTNIEKLRKNWDPEKNTYHVVIPVGRHDGTMFSTTAQAKSHANVYGMGKEGRDFTIEQQGNGFYIAATVPIDEKMDGIRDALIKIPGSYVRTATKNLKRTGTAPPHVFEDPITGTYSTRTWDTVQAFVNSRFGGIRSPEETLSPIENEQRKIATFGAARLHREIFEDNNRIIRSGRTDELKRVIQHAQNLPDPTPVDPNRTGKFFNLPEFYNEFQNVNNRMPTGKETEAYFAFKNNMQAEWALQSLAMMRNKESNGYMEWRIRRLDNAGKLTESDYFDAKPLDHFPTTPNSMYISTAGREFVVNASQLPSRYKKIYTELQDQFNKGEVKILQLWDRDTNPLHPFSSKINDKTSPLYVVTHNTDPRPLQFENQIPRRGGGHTMYPYDWYLRQPDVYKDPVTGKAIYRGDITAMPFKVRELGEQIATHFNNVRELLKNGNVVGARNYVNNLGVAGLDYDRDVHPWFFSAPVRGPKGQFLKGAKPRFNLDEDFRITRVDGKTIDIDKSLQDKYGNDFIDGTVRYNPAKGHSVQFTGKRDAWDLHTIDDKGTWKNPVYEYRPAEKIDPVDSMARATAKMSNSTFMEDYKWMAVEHWLQTFQKYIDADDKDIRHSPMYYFQKGELKKDTPMNIRMVAESNRKKVQDFVGQPSQLRNSINQITSKALDSLYKAGVPLKYLPYDKLAFEKDPIQAYRGLVADMKLGLFSIPAFFMQATAFSNVHAINPKQAPAASLAWMMHTWARAAPQHMDMIDQVASTKMLNWLPGFSKWVPGQFKEANSLLRETGFDRVGAEHAFWDRQLTNRGVGSKAQAIRYWGSTFFREGAESIRALAWYTAYKEFRDANPSGPLLREHIAQILNKATLLDHDMSRASNSSINSGLMSIPFQFFTYARNLAEDMYGKRLTWQQKARLFTFNGLLWGIPAGAIGMYGIPFGDVVDSYARKYLPADWQPEANPVSSQAINGLFSTLGAYITGHGDFESGTHYATSKFGVGQWEGINLFTQTDKPTWEMLGGASASTLGNTLSRSNPFLMDMYYLMTGQPSKHPAKLMDFVDLFKEASSVSYGSKIALGIGTHTWYSNNMSPLEKDITAEDAIFRGVTGINSIPVATIGLNKELSEARDERIKKVTSQISREMNLAAIDGQNGQDTSPYYARMSAIFEANRINAKDRTDILHEIAKRHDDLVTAQQRKLGNVHVEDGRLQEEMQKFYNFMRLRELRSNR